MPDVYEWHSVSDLIDLARKHAMPTEPGTLGYTPEKPIKWGGRTKMMPSDNIVPMGKKNPRWGP